MFFNDKTGKLHFTSISELRECFPPTEDEAIRQSTVRMPPRVYFLYFFQGQKRIYILDPPSHHKKGSLPHNFHVLAIFQGTWRFWVYECTCLRISHYFSCTLQVWVKIPWKVSMNQQAAQRHFYSLSPFDNLPWQKRVSRTKIAILDSYLR